MAVPQQPIDLGDMTPDLAQPAPELAESVLTFGDPDRRPRRRTALAGLARELADDRRTAPVCAIVGAVAVFASFVSEWQVTTVAGSALGNGALGDKVIPADLADLGSFGAGYLAGLFMLAVSVVLTLAGPAAGRRYARLAGLSIGGTLLGLMLALTSVLGDQSRIVSRLYTLELTEQQLKISYGRGLWCGLFGVIAVLLALYLAGRSTMMPWPRRPVQLDEDDDEPLELTVTSAKPFA